MTRKVLPRGLLKIEYVKMPDGSCDVIENANPQLLPMKTRKAIVKSLRDIADNIDKNLFGYHGRLKHYPPAAKPRKVQRGNSGIRNSVRAKAVQRRAG